MLSQSVLRQHLDRWRWVIGTRRRSPRRGAGRSPCGCCVFVCISVPACRPRP